jgi:thiol-disulfide isomerase/thioredoxin
MDGLAPLRLRLLPLLWLLLVASTASMAAGLVDPMTGERHKLEVGSPALHLVFFATWCPDCVDEIEGLSELDARWSGQGYQVILVAVKNRHTADRLREFLDGRELPFKLLWDEDGSTARRFNAKSIPTHVLLDSTGSEIARSSKLDNEIHEAVASTVDKRRRPRGRR